MCMPPCLLLSNGWQNRFLFSLRSFLLQKSLHFGGLELRSPFWNSRGTSVPHGEEIFDWFISSDLLPFNSPDTLILLHCSSGSRFSPDISFALSFALSCSWEVFQDFGSDHLLILLSVPPSPVYRPNKRPPPLPSIFRKHTWIALLPTLTFTVLLKRNTRFFIFPLLLLFLPLWH